MFADHIEPTRAEVANAASLTISPALARLALASARHPRPAVELLARLEREVERMAEQLARLGGRA